MNVQSSSFSRFYSDRSFTWRPGRVFIPGMNFTGMTVGAINEGGAGNFVYGQKWEGSHTGVPTSVEIAAAGVNAVNMDAAGDMVAHYMLLPYDYDPKHPMYTRVHWSSGSSDVADTIDWIVTYLPIALDTTVIADATTALDLAIAQDTVAAASANLWQATSFGSINGEKFATNVESIVWKVEMDAFAAGLTEAKNFLGLELRYTPKRFRAPDGMGHEAANPMFMLSNLY